MKCWQCGYDLRMHDGLKCPECGAVKSTPRPNGGEGAIVLTWGIVASIALAYCALMLAGTGGGSYLPLVIFFAPVALPGAGFAFFLGLPLYDAYAVAMLCCKKARHRHLCVLAIAVVHYGSLLTYMLLWPDDVATEGVNLLGSRYRNSGVISVSVTIFLATNLAMIAWAYWPRKAERHAVAS